MKSPWVLVVAGADSSARAGIAADREALEDQGVSIVSVVSAWTIQDASGLRGLSALAPDVWLGVARQALGRGPGALKFGLLPGAQHVLAAARLTREALAMGIPVVLDPVLSSSGGHRFLDRAGVRALRAELLVQRLIVTPNLIECAALAGRSTEELPLRVEQRVLQGEAILRLGAQAVLIKAGHGQEDPVRDLILERGKQPEWHVHPRLVGRSMGGSGCRYASALAGALARSMGLCGAAELAGQYVADKLLKA